MDEAHVRIASARNLPPLLLPFTLAHRSGALPSSRCGEHAQLLFYCLGRARASRTRTSAWSNRGAEQRPGEGREAVVFFFFFSFLRRFPLWLSQNPSMAVDVKSKLSKNLLRMKFMQRGLDAETKKQLAEEERKIISDEHWYLDLPELKEKESFIIEERSFVFCEDLVYGRMSFKGFNPEVEKLMITMNAKNKAEEEDEEGEMEVDVSDEEMARRYETLVGSIRKKYTKKRAQSVQDDEEESNHNKNIKPKEKRSRGWWHVNQSGEDNEEESSNHQDAKAEEKPCRGWWNIN
ncbi:M-phase phosphoprotein 6 [Rhinatrema bivittatum]|uniref:M-phase phosphoprotein 6 n=1 Tax=Rhinatrema bivittatum TaxID=194408 RepID=UPI00112A9DC4|nr:M-phase phosphoprotein 6 [Rhinatrema bivittatum]